LDGTLGGVLFSAFSFSEFTLGAGGFAAAIAVGAFIGQVIPGLTGAPEPKLRRDTVIGGLLGMGAAAFVIFLSAI
jgi:ABC-type uncharacterized transport system permease subunit